MIRKIKDKLVLVIIALLLSMAVSSEAGIIATLDVTYGTVKNVVTQEKGNVGAAEFDIKLTANPVNGMSLNKFDTYGYCVDLVQHIGKESVVFDLRSITEYVSFPDTMLGYYKSAWLMDKFAPGIGGIIGGTITTNDQINRATALQGIIWELTQNTGKVNNVGDVGTYYATYKNALNSFTLDIQTQTYLSSRFMIAHSGSKQDLIVEVPVPEPATMFLFGSGILGVAAFVRRQRR